MPGSQIQMATSGQKPSPDLSLPSTVRLQTLPCRSKELVIFHTIAQSVREKPMRYDADRYWMRPTATHLCLADYGNWTLLVT